MLNILEVLKQHEAGLLKVADQNKGKDFGQHMLYRAEQLANANARLDKLIKAALVVVDSAKPSPFLDALQDALTEAGFTPTKNGRTI